MCLLESELLNVFSRMQLHSDPNWDSDTKQRPGQWRLLEESGAYMIEEFWVNWWSFRQTCAKIPKNQRSWISRIKDPRSWRILGLIFSFSHGVLDILNPATAILPRDPRDLGSRTEKILLDPRDPGSSLNRLSWDLADLGCYPTIMSLYFEHPLHPSEFWFWFLTSTHCLK